jgi:hypothetical protein
MTTWKNKLLIFLLLIAFIYACFWLYARIYTKEAIESYATHVNFEHNQWNLPDNNTKLHSLYVIAANGYVIKRQVPIAGFLDSADYRFSASFNLPQTITGLDGTTWRVYSRTLFASNLVVGVAMIAYAYPPKRLCLRLTAYYPIPVI